MTILKRLAGLRVMEAFVVLTPTLDDGLLRGAIVVSGPKSAEAERAHLRPWTATQKLRYVRVNASEITGRRFKFGPEPDHAVVYD